MSKLSLCCGAPPIGETDLCSACKEHSGFGEEAPTGYLEPSPSGDPVFHPSPTTPTQRESARGFVRSLWSMTVGGEPVTRSERRWSEAIAARDAAIRAEGVREGMERAAKMREVLRGYGTGYETSQLRVPYARGYEAGQKAMSAAIRAAAQEVKP